MPHAASELNGAHLGLLIRADDEQERALRIRDDRLARHGDDVRERHAFHFRADGQARGNLPSGFGSTARTRAVAEFSSTALSTNVTFAASAYSRAILEHRA